MDFKKFVNDIYLNENTINQLKDSYVNSENILKLEKFLKPQVYEELIKLIGDLRGIKLEITNKYSYEDLGDLSGVAKLFDSKDFLNFVNAISKEKFDNINLKISGFGHKDYTLLQESEENKKGIEFLFIFSKKWDEKWGGQVIYTNNKNKSLVFPIIGNSFILLDKQDMGKFVKYINRLSS